MASAMLTRVVHEKEGRTSNLRASRLIASLGPRAVPMAWGLVESTGGAKTAPALHPAKAVAGPCMASKKTPAISSIRARFSVPC
jgi:hypothetical protein